MVLFALLLRLYVFFATPVIGTDGYNWFHAARCFAQGDFVAGARHPIHPLYPILFGELARLVGNYETAGKTVALIMGVLGLFPLYFITRDFFGHHAGLFAASLLAVNPTHVRLSADVMSDTTNLFFFLSAIWLGWQAIKRDAWPWYALAGVCVVLSYFTRAESIALFVVMLPWFILAQLKGLRGDPLNRVVRVGFFIAAVVLPSIPYIFFIHKEKGIWHVTQQGAALLTTGQERTTPGLSGADRRRREPEERVHEAAKIASWKEKRHYHMIFFLTLNEFAKDFYQPFLPFLVFGVFRLAKGTRTPGGPLRRQILEGLSSLRLRVPSSGLEGGFFLLSFFGLYFLLYYLLAYNAYYISGRYVLPMAVLSFVWAGAGMERVSLSLPKVLPSLDLDRETLGFSRAGLFLLLALLAVALPKDLKIKHKEEIVKKETGYWIKANSHVKNPVIMGIGELALEKVAFYAEGEFRHLSPEDYDFFYVFLGKWEPNYLVFYKEELAEEIAGPMDKDKRFVFLKEWNSKKKGKELHLRLYAFKQDH
jgi:4-amino-4-deoxy-L-arabinose transferase-like glycosyltransferase